MVTTHNGFTFEQGLTFDNQILQYGNTNLSFYVQCTASTIDEWPVDRVNMDTKFVYVHTPGDYIDILTISGKNLIQLMGM